MDLIFRIHYNAPGDSVLSLCGDTTVLGNNEQQNAPLMERLQEGWWELKVSFPSIPKEVNYRYTVVFPDGTSITEPSTHSLKDLPG
ncbi:MAG: CBM20 domain-containing protein, partial [Bacteroidales bacterium]